MSAPLTRRADLVRDQLAHPPHGTRRPPGAAPPVRLGVSGSGVELLVLAWSAADLARERAAGTRLLTRLGVAPGMRVANTLPGALATPGSLLLGDVVEELGALDVPLGPVDDGVVAEIADGVLVLTARGLDTSLQRYASDVPARLAAGPCPCGAAGTVLEVP